MSDIDIDLAYLHCLLALLYSIIAVIGIISVRPIYLLFKLRTKSRTTCADRCGCIVRAVLWKGKLVTARRREASATTCLNTRCAAWNRRQTRYAAVAVCSRL